MNYEIVNLEEKKVAGIRLRSSNNDPEMGRAIGEAWQNFFGKGIYESIPGRKNEKSIGLYTNYENNENGLYDVMVCCEVKENTDIPDSIDTEIIPSGKYAKFLVKGHVQEAVQEFWMKLWNMDLERRYSGDFEEYQPGNDMNNSEIHIYISLI